MKNTLKHFLSGICFLMMTGIIYAQTGKSTMPHQAGFYRMQLGDVEITALSDGTIPLPVDQLLLYTRPGEVPSLLKRAYAPLPLETSVNAFLLKTGGKLILVDAGTAELLGPALGFLSNSIKAAGYRPEDIEAVLITHIHTDHTGGLVEGNKMVFPNAQIYISKPEVDFWMNEANSAKVEERHEKFFDEAAAKVGPYLKAGKVKTFEYGQPLFPGITPIATPGHTPGHTFYALESKGEKMMFWGDIMHVAEVQLVRPAVAIQFDINTKAAIAQRQKAYAEAARQGYWIAAAHVAFPGIGHLRAAGKSYEWVPVIYKY